MLALEVQGRVRYEFTKCLEAPGDAGSTLELLEPLFLAKPGEVTSRRLLSVKERNEGRN